MTGPAADPDMEQLTIAEAVVQSQQNHGRASLAAFARDFARHAGPRLLPAGILLALGALIEGVGLLLLLPLLSVVFGSGSGNAWLDGMTRTVLALTPGGTRFWQIAALLALFALVMAVRGVIILGRDVLLSKLQVGFVEGRRVEVIRLLGNARWDVVSRLRHARITHVLGEDVQACGFASSLLLQSAIVFAMLVVQFALVVFLSPALALFVLLLAIASVFALGPILQRSRATGQRYTATQLELVNSTTQFLGGLKLAMSQNLQHSFVRAFENTIAKAAELQIGFARQRSLTQIALSAAIAGAAGAAILVGVGLLAMPPALLIAFLFILARMSGGAVRAQTSLQQIVHSLPAYDKVQELTAELRAAGGGEVAEAGGAVGPVRGAIAFRGVSFHHRADADGSGGISNVDVSIDDGDFVGLTGPSGAGKTTFADLLVGLYAPQAGEISIGGAPLDKELLGQWRQSISYVSQDSFLFHDSIRNNLLWASPAASESELWQALDAAGAKALVMRMPAGLDTVVGERGTMVSGGERQRIALARALLRRPSLLLLDEATSAIDPVAEAEIIRHILAFEPRPTIIMVAHRDESLRLCRRILRIADGRMIAV